MEIQSVFYAFTLQVAQPWLTMMWCDRPVSCRPLSQIWWGGWQHLNRAIKSCCCRTFYNDIKYKLTWQHRLKVQWIIITFIFRVRHNYDNKIMDPSSFQLQASSDVVQQNDHLINHEWPQTKPLRLWCGHFPPKKGTCWKCSWRKKLQWSLTASFYKQRSSISSHSSPWICELNGLISPLSFLHLRTGVRKKKKTPLIYFYMSSLSNASYYLITLVN